MMHKIINVVFWLFCSIPFTLSQFPFLDSIGVISPADNPLYVDVKDEYVRLTCTLTTSSLNSSFLYWGVTHFGETQHRYIVEGSIINDSSIELLLSSPLMENMTGHYNCLLNQSSIDLDPMTYVDSLDVIFDTRLAPVDSVTCVSPNFEYMICEFCPDPIPTRVAWVLNYTIDDSIMYRCPSAAEDLRNCQCNFSDSSTKLQNLTLSIWPFILETEGVYGPRRDHHVLYNKYIVRPNAVRDVTVQVLGSEDIMMSWQPDGFATSLHQQNETLYIINVTDQWLNVETIEVLSPSKSVHLSNLKPFSEYSVQVWCQNRLAPDTQVYMSDPSELIPVRTSADAPTFGPAIPGFRKSDSACLEDSSVSNCVRVYVYFEEIPEEYRNGLVIMYSVTCHCENGFTETKNINNIPQNTFHSEFIIDDSVTCNVTIHAFTTDGINSNNTYKSPPSSIYIYKQDSIPQTVDLIALETDGNSTGISVFWEYNDEAENFTLMWCSPVSSQHLRCQNSPKHKIVPGSERTCYIDDYNSDYRYAIAVNTFLTGSSPLTDWLPVCIYDAAPDALSYSVQTNGIERSLTITWNNVGCSLVEPLGLVLYYNISWTDGTDLEYSLVNATQHSYVHDINNLLPYTIYTFYMTAYTRAHDSGAVIRVQRTEESVPDDPPYDVRVINVTSLSVLLEWLPPRVPNGVIQRYLIQPKGGFNDQNQSSAANETSWLLDGLDGFVNYSIHIYAENSAGFSPQSNIVFAETLVRAPAKIEVVDADVLDKTYLETSWSTPVPPNGPITTYTVVHTVMNKSSDDQLIPPQHVTGNETSVSLNIEDICEDYNDEIQLLTYVYATTQDENGETFEGIASDPVSNKACLLPVSNLWLYSVIALVLLLFAIIFCIVICCFIQRRNEKGKTVDIILPEMLDRETKSSYENFEDGSYKNEYDSRVESVPNDERMLQYGEISTEAKVLVDTKNEGKDSGISADSSTSSQSSLMHTISLSDSCEQDQPLGNNLEGHEIVITSLSNEQEKPLESNLEGPKSVIGVLSDEQDQPLESNLKAHKIVFASLSDEQDELLESNLKTPDSASIPTIQLQNQESSQTRESNTPPIDISGSFEKHTGTSGAESITDYSVAAACSGTSAEDKFYNQTHLRDTMVDSPLNSGELEIMEAADLIDSGTIVGSHQSNKLSENETFANAQSCSTTTV